MASVKRVEVQRVVRLAEESRVLTMRKKATGTAHGLGQYDVRGQIGTTPTQVSGCTAGVRGVEAAREQAAGYARLKKLKQRAEQHPINKTEKRVQALATSPGNFTMQ